MEELKLVVRGVGVGLALAMVAGCHSAKPAGSSLPVTSAGSVALPGAVDAADAPSAPAVAESSSADLVAYRDPAHGVSFQYPSVWRPEQVGGSLPQPDFVAVAPPPLITQSFHAAGTYYANTVLSGLSFSYTVQAKSNAAMCAQIPARAVQNAGTSGQVSYNGVEYHEARGTDAGMCHQLGATVDSALHGTTCYIFERDTATICPDVKTPTEPRPLTQSERNALQRHLDAVMQSVRLDGASR